MVCVCTLFVFPLLIISIWVYRKIKNSFEVPAVPKLEQIWWGPGDRKTKDETIEPFVVNVSDEVLDDLKHRLEIALPFQTPLEGAKQHYGLNTNVLRTVVDYWKNEYDWKTQEKFLNQYPQFKVSIQGLKIHFLHVKPQKSESLKVFPLLMLHGWPGSVREFYEIIPLLTTKQTGRNFVFEVIVPSLPGYGFSDGAIRKGLNPSHVAVIFKNLMEKLGFKKYFIQGGDWGSVIISNMAILFPENLLGIHSNMPYSRTPKAVVKTIISSYFPKVFLNANEDIDYFNLQKSRKFWESENAYGKLHGTKPDTVGVGLRDSPVGLAAYILEKFITWTNRDWRDLEDGGLTRKYTYTKLLDNVMIYWVTRTMTTAMRIYKEHNSPENLELDKIPINDVPCGCSRFFYDIMCLPESIIKEKYQNLVHITFHRNGGHFAAFEVPDILAGDIYDFVEKVKRIKDL